MARICVIREWYFPVDSRLKREIDALVDAGHEVDLICATIPGQPRLERIGRLSVHRVPLTRRRAGLLRYVFEFVAFQLAATVLAAVLHLRRRYDLVQVNSLPDWLVFAAIVPWLLGARVLLDLHECMPEYAITRYDLRPAHPVVRLLAFIEQASIRFADGAITCTEQMRERFVERGVPREKVGVVLNSFDEGRLDPAGYQTPRHDERFVLICHGTIDENFGIDLVVRAVALLEHTIPGLRLEVYGDGTQRQLLLRLVKDLGLEERVWFSPGFIPLSELLARIASADVGVVAIRRDVFRDLTHCNKMYDLIAMRKPVVISRTRAVEAYFGDDCFQLFESGNERDLARAIAELYADPQRRERLVRRATEVNEPYRWVHQRTAYLATVERLLGDREARVQQALLAQGGKDA